MKFVFSGVALLLTFPWMYRGTSASECQPHSWSITSVLEVGEINCREDTISAGAVGPNTCRVLAEKSEISLEEFMFLNPDLDESCHNIKPNAEYCVVGCE